MRLHGILNSAIIEGRAAPAIGEIDLHGTNRERIAGTGAKEKLLQEHTCSGTCTQWRTSIGKERNLEHCAVGELGPFQYPDELGPRSEHAVGVLFSLPIANIDLARECLICDWHLRKQCYFDNAARRGGMCCDLLVVSVRAETWPTDSCVTFCLAS